jgi:hypothetical protein
MAAKGNGKSDVFHHTLTHLRGLPVVLVRTLRVEPDGSTNQRSSAANIVPAAQSASQISELAHESKANARPVAVTKLR